MQPILSGKRKTKIQNVQLWLSDIFIKGFWSCIRELLALKPILNDSKPVLRPNLARFRLYEEKKDAPGNIAYLNNANTSELCCNLRV